MKEINYTIQEDDVEGYSTEINGMNIVNSYTPGQTSINVVKAWDDAQIKMVSVQDLLQLNYSQMAKILAKS